MDGRKKYVMSPEDREKITHKYYLPEQPHDGYSRFSYHGYDFDESTGLSDEQIRKELAAMAERQPENMPRFTAKAEAVVYVLDNTRIDVNDNDWYVGIYSWGRLVFEPFVTRWLNDCFQNTIPDVYQTILDNSNAALCSSWLDFDHAVPDWDAVMTLGFPGMLERVRKFRLENESRAPLTEEQAAYYDALDSTLSAVLRLLERMKNYAEGKTGKKIPKIAACLDALIHGAPADTYEALQLMYLFFMVSESVDCYQCRSLGNGFDRIIEPYYRRDLESGHYTQQELDDFLAEFMMQFYAIGNYWGQPLFMGGTKEDGTTKYTPFARRVLELWDDLEIHNPKIQLLFGKSTPKEIRYLVYDIIRRGKYLTVVCEDGTRRAVKAGYDCTDEEARDFIVSGCYEPLVRGGTVIVTGYPNLAKLVSLTMRDGFDGRTQKQLGPHTGLDFPDFESFFNAFEQQFAGLFSRLCPLADSADRYLSHVNPAILLSATKEESLQRMEDGYSMADSRATAYFGMSGYATCVDSLAAIRHLVYETGTVTLPEFVKALDANWEGYEELHRKALRECPKYGNATPEADTLARRVSDLIPRYITCRRNLRGARFVVEFHAAMHYAWQGEKTEATPDGRYAGTELSRNASPSVGADVSGSTAFILSCTDAVYPECATAGFNADVMLHPSALEGEEGLTALDALIGVYRKRGGMNIQFNVVSPEILRDAQKHPEEYQNLQIRVSGWNVLWNDIPPVLQEAYILRAESVTGN